MELALHRAKGIAGWMSDAELLFLAQLAKESHVIIEVGCFLGKSTRALGDNTPGIVYAVDPWDYVDSSFIVNDKLFTVSDVDFGYFLRNLNDLIVIDKVRPVRADWRKWEPKVVADLIFIDGNHDYPFVLKDIQKAKLHVGNDSIIAGHDYYLESVRTAVHDCFKNKQINVVDTIWSVEV